MLGHDLRLAIRGLLGHRRELLLRFLELKQLHQTTLGRSVQSVQKFYPSKVPIPLLRVFVPSREDSGSHSPIPKMGMPIDFARAFDLALGASGIRWVTVTFDGAPVRTLGVWLPPSLQGRLHAAQINGVPQVTRETHPAALTEVFASPDLRTWQWIPEINLPGFITDRSSDDSWFFRSGAR